MRAARFPTDEAADPSSLAKAPVLASGRPVFSAPQPAARQTAAAISLALSGSIVAELAEPDFGRWGGLPYGQVDQEELAGWLVDPEVAPHGGESLAAHASRVAGWLAVAPADAVVVCDVWTIRAALGLSPLVAARFDLAPLSTTEVSGGRITHVNRKVTS